jgi:hypothetical protein
VREGGRERERERESKCMHNKNFSRGNYFFGLVFIKKIIKLNLFLKKTETTSNRPVLVLFFRTKTGSNRFGSVFLFWLGFFSGLGSVRFFWFQAYKTETNRTDQFFQNFNWFNQFFSRFGFFGFFFLVFSV